ncbi:hypothetical protein QUC31_001948 [Theobroma cacao]
MPDATHSWVTRTMNLKEYRAKCLHNSSYMAYASSDNRGRDSGWGLWFDNLIDYRQFQSEGQDLYVRVSASESGKPGLKLATMIATPLCYAFGAVLSVITFTEAAEMGLVPWVRPPPPPEPFDGYFACFPNFKKIEKQVKFRDLEIERCDDRVVSHDLQRLNICECDDFKCLNNIPLFRKATDLKKCQIWECEGMECVVDLSLSSCDALDNIEELHLFLLENLREVVRVGVGVGVAVEIESTSHAPTPPAIFSSLKKLDLFFCSKIKKLFPVELSQGLQNLEEIHVERCEEMEEIIASEENHKEKGTTFILPKLKSLKLVDLPKLKSICSGGLMIPADSLQFLHIVECPEVKRIPLSLPLVENGKPSPPPSLPKMTVSPREWWESVEWDQPDAKEVLSPFVEYW